MRDSSLDEFVGGADGDESAAERADGATADPGGEGDAGPESEPESETEPEPNSEAEGEPEPSSGGGQEMEEQGSPDARADERAVEPAVSTMNWTPDGAACAACEQLTERRWQADGELVCSSCKTW